MTSVTRPRPCDDAAPAGARAGGRRPATPMQRAEQDRADVDERAGHAAAGSDGRSRRGGPVDVLHRLARLDPGLRAADDELAALAAPRRRDVELAAARARSAQVRTLALTDLRWALRRAPRGARAIARAPTRARSSTPRRPRRCCGRAGRDPLRRARGRQPARAPRALAATARAPAAARGVAADAPGRAARSPRRGRRRDAVDRRADPRRAVRPGEPWRERDLAAVTYATNPRQEGPGSRAGARGRARAGAGEELVVAGLAAAPTARACALAAAGARSEYRGAAAPGAGVRHGAAARGLRDRAARGAGRGCLLVTTAAPGRYAALPARASSLGRLRRPTTWRARCAGARRPGARLRRACARGDRALPPGRSRPVVADEAPAGAAQRRDTARHQDAGGAGIGARGRGSAARGRGARGGSRPAEEAPRRAGSGPDLRQEARQGTR